MCSQADNETVLIVGGTSAIGRAVADAFAQAGYGIFVAGRCGEECQRIAEDLRVRYQITAAALPFQAEDFDRHAPFVEQCFQAGPLAGAVLCHGYMPDQAQALRDADDFHRTVAINYTSAVSLLNELTPRFEQSDDTKKRRRFLAAITSVAGDRGRRSNFVYGSNKAALATYLQGLRAHLHPAGVSVTTIKPGFVDTAMTWGLLNSDSPMVASPRRVGRDVYRAVRRGRAVCYSPWFWRPIMAIIRAVPEPVAKRLNW
jgi:NAD(P)-dependent dehydrogenase (short-subunit alcohol dehydrogenase family)